MLWVLASVLLVAWIVALAVKVTVGPSTCSIVAALILHVWGFVRGRTAPPPVQAPDPAPRPLG